MSGWQSIAGFLTGAAVIVICSAARLRSPQADRSYTTYYRFCIQVAYYSTAYLGLYYLCFALVSWAAHALGAESAGIFGYFAQSPVLVALLILLLSRVPPASTWDDALRRHAQQIGGIPFEALRLRDAILGGKCQIREAGSSEIYYSALRRGLDFGNMQALPGYTLLGLFKHGSELRYILEECERQPRFAGFFADNSRLVHDLKSRFDDLLFKASRAFAALGSLSGLVDRTSGVLDTWDSLGSLVETEVYTGSASVLDPTIAASRVLLNSLRDEMRLFRADVALILARLTLQARRSARGRVALLESMGITVQDLARSQYGVLLIAFGVVFSLLWIGTALFSASGREGERASASQMLMVSTFWVVALLCAIYPKQHFAFANVTVFGRLPYSYFAAVGFTAAAAAFVIGLASRTLIYKDAEVAWHFALVKSPGLLVPFTLAILVAILIQDTDEFATRSQRAMRRWLDAGVLAVGLAAAVAVVRVLLAYTNPGPSRPAWILGLVALIGGTLGYLVPHHYRNVCAQPPPCKVAVPKLEGVDVNDDVDASQLRGV